MYGFSIISKTIQSIVNCSLNHKNPNTIASMKAFKTNLSKLISLIEKTFFMKWIPKIFKFVDLRMHAQFYPFYLYLK